MIDRWTNLLLRCENGSLMKSTINHQHLHQEESEEVEDLAATRAALLVTFAKEEKTFFRRSKA